MLKRIFLALALALVVIQFFRPAKNLGPSEPTSKDVLVMHPAPAAVASVLRESCYDCHSNRTRYPWYAEVQPVAWWLGHHVEEGKDELNFSQFGDYSVRRAGRKLRETVELIEKDEMPLPSYLWMHAGARLSPEQKLAIKAWAEPIAAEYEAKQAAQK